MAIRAYRPEDFEAVLALWRAVSLATYDFLAPHTEAEDRAYLEGVIVPNHDLWLEEDAGRLRGYLAIQGGLIDRLYVTVADQGRGVGTRLLAHARSLSPAGLRLFTHQRNGRACRFYERRGFVPVRYGLSPAPERAPDVEYRWEPEGS